MNETTNLKLKKPAGNEYISVETINGNMDIIDTGMKEISDSVDAPEFDASGTVEGITDKAGLLAGFVTRMPLVKFMRNVVAGFNLVLYAGQVVNNCVTDNAKLPLSAAQGKVLMDLYNVLNTNLTMCFTEVINLCQNASGVITLSDSVYNYKMLRFENSNFGFSSSPIYGTQPIIRAGTVSVSGDAMVLCCGAWTVSNNGKTLTPSYMVQANITASGVTYFNRNAGLAWNIIGYRK